MAERGASLRRQTPCREHRSDPGRATGLEVDHAVTDVDRMRPRQTELPDGRQQRIRRRLWRGDILITEHHVEVPTQARRLQLGLDKGPSLAGDHTKWGAGLVQLPDERWNPAEDPGMAQGRGE